MMYYLTKHQDRKEQLLNEILPPLEKMEGDILKNFDYDTAMSFDFLQQCFYETIRLESPAVISNPQVSIEDIHIGKGKD